MYSNQVYLKDIKKGDTFYEREPFANEACQCLSLEDPRTDAEGTKMNVRVTFSNGTQETIEYYQSAASPQYGPYLYAKL